MERIAIDNKGVSTPELGLHIYGDTIQETSFNILGMSQIKELFDELSALLELGWISVDEFLPSPFLNVWVKDANEDAISNKSATYSNGKWACFDGAEIKIKVTHWKRKS